MKDLKSLESVAKNIRRSIVSMICEAKSGHPGGSLSIVDILTALYYGEMKIDPTKPKMEGRDRFVLSKGHAAPALYAVLAERGYFPKEELMTLRKFGSHLQGHPDMKKFREWKFQQDLWDKAYLLPMEWHSMLNCFKKSIECML